MKGSHSHHSDDEHSIHIIHLPTSKLEDVEKLHGKTGRMFWFSPHVGILSFAVDQVAKAVSWFGA